MYFWSSTANTSDILSDVKGLFEIIHAPLKATHIDLDQHIDTLVVDVSVRADDGSKYKASMITGVRLTTG